MEKKQYKLFEFEVSNDELTSSVIEGAFGDNLKLGKIIVMGISRVVKQVFFNNKDVQFDYDKEKSVSSERTFIIVKYHKEFCINSNFISRLC